jgi:hypothetical protein
MEHHSSEIEEVDDTLGIIINDFSRLFFVMTIAHIARTTFEKRELFDSEFIHGVFFVSFGTLLYYIFIRQHTLPEKLKLGLPHDTLRRKEA